MFRRRRSEGPETEPETGPEAGPETEPEAEPETGPAVDAHEPAAPPVPAVAEAGPFDAVDAPADELPRLDLGGLLVPVSPDVEIRVEFDQQAGQVVAATFVAGQGALQVNAFAAPRSAGIWAEVREEIAATLRSSGGGAEEVEGPFGTELHAQVPAEGGALAPARFVGVDGPRWFLRGLLSGAAAVDATQAAPLERAFRQIVVVRGGEAMAPRDPLPLRLPREAMEAAQQAAAGQAAFDPFERGPEISEVR